MHLFPAAKLHQVSNQGDVQVSVAKKKSGLITIGEIINKDKNIEGNVPIDVEGEHKDKGQSDQVEKSTTGQERPQASGP